MSDKDLRERSINTLRFLAADAVQKANSGHPGLPMGMAPVAYVLWSKHILFDPGDPSWPNRDRFILSAGHGSMLLYAVLHLTGYDLPLEEIMQFRQWDSITPGHPENHLTPGVEVTTGPLGQGFGNGIGMAFAADHLAAMYNREGFAVYDNYVYGIVSDGDLMEGVASEAASLAGHFRLGRLIYIYDDNRISIDGSTDLTFTEDRAARFEAYDWHVLKVEDSKDIEAVDRAIQAAKEDPRPSLIVCRSQIGYGLPTKQGTAAAHGEPPGEEELAGAKDRLGWPQEPDFYIPEEVKSHFRSFAERGKKAHQTWLGMMEEYAQAFPDLHKQWSRTMEGGLPENLESNLPEFKASESGMATRAASGQTLNSLAPKIPEFFGGSADLTGSNKTDIKGEEPFTRSNRSGRYVHFGVREHAMGAALTGIALYKGLIPYAGTFLVFSDYMRPSVRLAALSRAKVIYVYTHDSVGLGEDGPTHQPIEHLPSLRAIPNFTLIRPADANETAQAWLAALRQEGGPSALVLTRQNVPVIDRSHFASAKGLHRGAYILADWGEGDPAVILMASGSEVQLIIEAGKKLMEGGISVRLVSFPSWELFNRQPADYRNEIFPLEITARVAVEAASPYGWERWIGDRGAIVGLERFGASAPYPEIYDHLDLTAEHIVDQARRVMRS